MAVDLTAEHHRFADGGPFTVYRGKSQVGPTVEVMDSIPKSASLSASLLDQYYPHMRHELVTGALNPLRDLVFGHIDVEDIQKSRESDVVVTSAKNLDVGSGLIQGFKTAKQENKATPQR